jgi:Spy/CpxP family protein refolding chaperone
MTSIKIVLSVLFIVIATSFISAQSIDKKGGPGSQGNMHRSRMSNKEEGKDFAGHLKFMREKLHLTDQQVSKIEGLRSDHMKKMIDLKADLEKSMIDMKSIREKDNFTRADIISAVDKSNKIKNDMALSKANHLMDIWEILTPEQQKMVKDNPQWLMGGRHPMMHKRMGDMRHPMNHKGSDGKKPPMPKDDNNK